MALCILTESIVDEPSVIERYFKPAVSLYCGSVVLYSFMKIHAEVLYLSTVVVCCGQISRVAIPVEIGHI